MFTELSVGCWSSGHSNVMYQVSSSTVFFLVSYMHIHAPFIMYCSRLFVVVFQERNCLHMPMFVGSQSFISQPSFMFVSAPVSVQVSCFALYAWIRTQPALVAQLVECSPKTWSVVGSSPT